MADESKSPKIRDEDRNFDTSTPEANRSIEQGDGVGAKELAAQREPAEADGRDPFKDSPGAAEAAERAQG